MLFHREVSSGGWPPYYKLYSQTAISTTAGVFPCYSPSGVYLICNDKTAAIHHNQIMQMNADGTSLYLFGDSIKGIGPGMVATRRQNCFGFGRVFKAVWDQLLLILQLLKVMEVI